jgi:hypothetical protein
MDVCMLDEWLSPAESSLTMKLPPAGIPGAFPVRRLLGCYWWPPIIIM